MKDLSSLKDLHNKGIIDDKAFIAGVKKININTPLGERVDSFPRPLRDNPITWPKGSGTSTPTGSILGIPSITAGNKYVSKGSPLTATYTPHQEDVPVIPFTEDRSHLPSHARDVLMWIDEAWDATFRNYNDTKKDWIREEDDDGKISWTHVPSQKVEYELDNLRTMFNLEVDGDNQP